MKVFLDWNGNAKFGSHPRARAEQMDVGVSGCFVYFWKAGNTFLIEFSNTRGCILGKFFSLVLCLGEASASGCVVSHD